MKYCPICGQEYADGETCARDGAVLIRAQQGTDRLIGQVLKGSYRIEEQIGAGGMGTVYRAVQMPLGRKVAVKILLPALQSTQSMIRRFFQEAKLLSQLSHPNVVAIIDFGNTDTGMIFMVMELLEGATLADAVPRGRGLGLAATVALVRQICAGVGAAHHCQLVHRDLKPENIFIAAGSGALETVKILDFGIARALEGQQETRLTHTGMLMGTPGFIAPEQIEATADADARCDLYAIGAILYFMLTGRRPYHGSTPHSILAQQLQEAPSLDLEPLGENQPLAPVVVKAMSREPADRFQTAEEMVAAIDRAVGGVGPEAATRVESTLRTAQTLAVTSTRPRSDSRPPAATELVGGVRPAPPTKRWRWVLATVIIVATLGGLVGWMTSRDVGSRGRRPVTQDAGATVRGITDEEILIGMSAAFSGPSRELGRGMQLGIETCFRDLNERGGIHGRALRLIALDDGYEPSRTVANMADLLFERSVFAVLGNVGTPTAEVALPLILEQRIPFFGALSGADLLRKNPPDRYVFNYRASYAEETRAIVEHLLDGLGLQPAQIAVFAQQDAFGDAGYRGVIQTLAQRGYRERVPRLGYRRNTFAVEDAVEALVRQHADARAVVLVASYRAAAELIRQLVDRDRDLVFASLSFVGSRALAEELGELGARYAAGVIVTQVVPHFASPAPGVARYRQLLARHFPAEQPGFVSLEGYLASRVFAEALRRAGPDLSVEGLVEAAESIAELDLETGSRIAFGPDRHQGSSQVWGTVLDSAATYRPLALGAGSSPAPDARESRPP